MYKFKNIRWAWVRHVHNLKRALCSMHMVSAKTHTILATCSGLCSNHTCMVDSASMHATLDVWHPNINGMRETARKFNCMDACIWPCIHMNYRANLAVAWACTQPWPYDSKSLLQGRWGPPSVCMPQLQTEKCNLILKCTLKARSIALACSFSCCCCACPAVAASFTLLTRAGLVALATS